MSGSQCPCGWRHVAVSLSPCFRLSFSLTHSTSDVTTTSAQTCVRELLPFRRVGPADVQRETQPGVPSVAFKASTSILGPTYVTETFHLPHSQTRTTVYSMLIVLSLWHTSKDVSLSLSFSHTHSTVVCRKQNTPCQRRVQSSHMLLLLLLYTKSNFACITLSLCFCIAKARFLWLYSLPPLSVLSRVVLSTLRFGLCQLR